LDGGADGLSKIRAIAAELRGHLNPDGVVLIEVGCDQGQRVVEILEKAGLTDISIETDMAGKDRFIVGRCP
jgi:release factor glutamine methyltransferase